MASNNWQIKTRQGKIYGPVETETLRGWIQEKRILAGDAIWDEEKKGWTPIETVAEFYDLFKGKGAVLNPPSPAPEVRPQQAQAAPAAGTSETSGQEQSSGVVFSDENSVLTFQLITDAWRAMLGKGIWSIIGALFLLIIVSGVGSGLSELIPVAGIFIQLIISASVALGWAAYSLRVARREFNTGVGTIFEGFRGNYIWQALGAMLLMAIIPAGAGLISFGIWGFYLSIAYTQTYFFVYDDNRGPWESMKSSFDATKGYKWRILAVQIVCYFLGMLFLGIGLIVTMPLANIAIASLYYRIRTGQIYEKHARTKFIEYLIVLIPVIVGLALLWFVFFHVVKNQLPLLVPYIEEYMKNLPR